MANLFLTEPVYLSLTDLRETTTNLDLKEAYSVDDDNVKILVWKAQDIIDNLITDYWIPNIENQETIFPIKNDDWTDNVIVPIVIQKATVLLIENLYVGWVLDWWAYWTGWNSPIKSETSRGHTISYYSWTTSAIDINEFMNDEIMIYLKPYILNLSVQWYK